MLSSGLLPNQHYQGLGEPKEKGHIQGETTRKDETKHNSQYAFKSQNSYMSQLIKSHSKIKLHSTLKRNKTTKDKTTQLFKWRGIKQVFTTNSIEKAQKKFWNKCQGGKKTPVESIALFLY